MNLGAVYVCSSDLERAEEFYSGLFEAEPSMEMPQSIGYQLDGGLFLIMDEAQLPVPIEYGNNCVPNFEVPDIDAAFERVTALDPTKMSDDIDDAGPYRLFEFADPDGNILECYEAQA